MNRTLTLGLAGVLVSIAANCKAADQSGSANDKCAYQSNPGTEIVFAEKLTTGYEGDKYSDFYPEPDSMKKPVDYDDYVGKHAKVDDKPVLGDDNIAYFRKVTTDNCQVVFLKTGLLDSSDNPSLNPFQSLSELADDSHFYLVSDVNTAQKLIGKTIWIKRPSSQTAPYPDEEPFIEKSLHNVDPVKVLEIDLKNHGLSWETPIKLLVETANKKQGLINYGERYVYTQNPIGKKWSKQAVEAIKSNKVYVGMNEEQARLSWGEPEHINTTMGAAFQEEQWVYGSGYYLYFTNGKLTNLQTSK